MEKRTNFSHFFEPQGVAVIGSLRKEAMVSGYLAVKSLLESGYKGHIFPVGHGHTEVHGMRSYTSISEVPMRVDLAIIMINSRGVPEVMKECAAKGVKAVVLVTDGFAERGREGARLQEDVLRIARAGGIRIVGPNTAGILNTRNGLNPCPYLTPGHKISMGPVSLGAQTGLVNPQAFPYSNFPMGVSKVCDFGNKCDLDECDFLEYLESDESTAVICLHLESIRDGRKFLEISRRVTTKKPLLVLKTGRTKAGAKASASHSGSLSVDDEIFECSCRQSNVIRLKGLSELFEVPKIFATRKLPRGDRLGIVTFTGAAGVIAIDEAQMYALRTDRLTTGTAGMLDAIFPGLGKLPVDVGPLPGAVRDFFSVYPKILKAVVADEQVDCILSVLWADPSGEATVKTYTEVYHELSMTSQKPIATWIYGPDKAITEEIANSLEKMGFPVFADPATAVRALGVALQFASRSRDWGPTTTPSRLSEARTHPSCFSLAGCPKGRAPWGWIPGHPLGGSASNCSRPHPGISSGGASGASP